ncbi:hypothetical protein BSAF29S_01382 [Bacillus safensis subsp. safensis]
MRAQLVEMLLIMMAVVGGLIKASAAAVHDAIKATEMMINMVHIIQIIIHDGRRCSRNNLLFEELLEEARRFFDSYYYGAFFVAAAAAVEKAPGGVVKLLFAQQEKYLRLYKSADPFLWLHIFLYYMACFSRFPQAQKM